MKSIPGKFCPGNGRIMFVRRGNAASPTITKGIGFVKPKRDLGSGSDNSLCSRALPNSEFDSTPPSLWCPNCPTSISINLKNIIIRHYQNYKNIPLLGITNC